MWSPSFTSTFLTVVPTGACASKFSSGSIFPFVEIMLRIVVRSAVAKRTGTASPRDINDARNTTAATMVAAPVNQGWRAKKPLFFPFKGMGSLNSLMYHLLLLETGKEPDRLDAGVRPKNRKSL